MKNFLVLIFVMVSAAAWADMTVVQVVHAGPMMGQPAKDDTMTMYIKGTKARIDFKKGNVSEIVDLNTHKMHLIQHDKKEVMVMSTDIMKPGADIMSKLGNAKADIQKTGRTDTINGYKCEEYKVTTTGPMSMTATYWITRDVDASEYQPFQKLAHEVLKMFWNNSAEEMKGMPIRTNSKINMMGQAFDSSTEVQKVTHEAIADSMFKPPEGYKVSEMPKMSH